MILLTGATGRVAGSAARTLAESGVPFRVFVRDPGRFALEGRKDIDTALGDLQNEADVQRALEGVTRALLVTANGEQQADLECAFARQAAAAGVQHIVKISSMEAAPGVTAAFPKLHFQCEEFIKGLDVAWTMVRPNFFMQNLLLFAQGIANADSFALPLGRAKTGMIDAEDVGAVCAAILTTAGHENRTYEVTGAELLDFHQVAARMSAVLGRDIRYVEQSAGEFRAFLGRFIKSEWHLDGVCGLFAEIANHSLERTTSTVIDVIGREPASLEMFVERHASVFTPVRDD